MQIKTYIFEDPMGNEISTQNSISYYQKEFCGEENKPQPIFALNKVHLLENHDIEEQSIVFLFALDNDHDGLISSADIQKFIETIKKGGLDPNDCDFGFKCGAFCTEILCKYLLDHGKDSFRIWFDAGISSSFEIKEINDLRFIDDNAVSCLFDLLQIKSLLGRDFQWVLNMLQRHAESNLKMNLNDEAYDELVPVETILSFVTQIANGMVESYTMLTNH